MVVKLYPSQVSAAWDYIGGIIEISLPPNVTASHYGMTNILISIMKEQLEVFMLTDERMKNPIAVFSVSVEEDKHTLERNLLIYSFSAVGHLTPSGMNEVFNWVKDYARQLEVKNVIAFVEDDKIKNYLKTLGANSDYTLMEFKL